MYTAHFLVASCDSFVYDVKITPFERNRIFLFSTKVSLRPEVLHAVACLNIIEIPFSDHSVQLKEVYLGFHKALFKTFVSRTKGSSVFSN